MILKLEDLPWIKRLKKSTTCDGLKYSRMPLKALYRHGPKRSLPPTGVEPYRCKSPAYYHFKGLKSATAWGTPDQTGNYCWNHLIYQAMGSPEHEIRIERWIKRYRKDLLSDKT